MFNQPTSDRHGFNQRERDSESDTQHFRARAYSPKLGRFLGKDPILSLRVRAHFTYGGNNPLMRGDPLGQQDAPRERAVAPEHLQDPTKQDRTRVERSYLRNLQGIIWDDLMPEEQLYLLRSYAAGIIDDEYLREYNPYRVIKDVFSDRVMTEEELNATFGDTSVGIQWAFVPGRALTPGEAQIVGAIRLAMEFAGPWAWVTGWLLDEFVIEEDLDTFIDTQLNGSKLHLSLKQVASVKQAFRTMKAGKDVVRRVVKKSGHLPKETTQRLATTARRYESTEDYSKAIEKAGKLFPKKAGKTEVHHIVPKYLGGDPQGPTAPLDAAYHQLITNEFRRLWPYGSRVRPSQTQIEKFMRMVYDKYPLPKE